MGISDELEGKIPRSTKQKMDYENQEWKKKFPDSRQQIDNWNGRNEEGGRNLIIVNCWFIGEKESEKMWEKYASIPEGIAIKSTPKKLLKSVCLIYDKNISHMGRVKYVSHPNHEMGRYDANQAIERAFIKDREEFEGESELRLATHNFKPTGNRGQYRDVLIHSLFNKVVVSPQSSDHFYKRVKRLIELYKIKVNVSHSSLSIE